MLGSSNQRADKFDNDEPAQDGTGDEAADP